MKNSRKPTIYGLIAEFDNPNKLLHAARSAREEGYRRMDCYTPYPIEELTEALGVPHTKLPFIVLLGGIIGGVSGYLLQYWINVIDYPINIGGRPQHSWPAFIVPTFELTILGAAVAAVLGMLALNGLPRPHHPIFNAPNFALASRDRFFLCIEAVDPKFDLEKTARFLESFGAREVSDVEN
jgi:hypothetical protein